MNKILLDKMVLATALTRAGKLKEATELLLGNLDRANAADAVYEGDTIDGTFTPARKAETRPLRSSRKPLGATLRELGFRPPSRPSPESPGNAQFSRLRHMGKAGGCDYMLFVPQPMPVAPCPVLIMLHGCTQTADDFATGTQMNELAQSQGVIVVYPEQNRRANLNRCWNWFRPEDQQRDQGEPAMLADLTRAVIACHKADPTRVYVAGLSAGGAAAVNLAQAYPDMFAAAGVHSGLAAGAASDVGSAFSAMRNGAEGHQSTCAVPTIVFHGTADATVNVANVRAIAKQAFSSIAGLCSRTSTSSFGGRSYCRTGLTTPGGHTVGEVWIVDGGGHAWSGGSSKGSFTDTEGPDASAEMLRFFTLHRLG